MSCNVLIIAFIVNVSLRSPCAGKSQARFCVGGYHRIETNFHFKYGVKVRVSTLLSAVVMIR